MASNLKREQPAKAPNAPQASTRRYLFLGEVVPAFVWVAALLPGGRNGDASRWNECLDCTCVGSGRKLAVGRTNFAKRPTTWFQVKQRLDAAMEAGARAVDLEHGLYVVRVDVSTDKSSSVVVVTSSTRNSEVASHLYVGRTLPVQYEVGSWGASEGTD